MGRGWKNETVTELIKIPAWLVSYGDQMTREFRNERSAANFARKVGGEPRSLMRDNFDAKPGDTAQGWCEEQQNEMRGKWTGVTQTRPDRIGAGPDEIWTEILADGQTIFVME